MDIIEETYNWAYDLEIRYITGYIILHHAAASSCTAQDIHRWHLNNGWAGIGYHFFVAKDGKVYRGRPADTVGAHTYGYNNRSIGICAEGDYVYDIMPAQQKASIVALCKVLLATYKSAAVYGHRELNATECPGANFPLEAIKEEVLNVFKDVPANHWAADYINYLAQKGVIVGDEQGNFGLGKPMLREEMAVVLAKTIKLLENK
ncbi:N-acetylmuramoyl-L-alanine amidase [Pelotomaculum propionicicum]|uniref:S-layer protein n=1 Tax=Pelotomaculum propionicicum TaxID=258475 RepID=A0A4Y7RLB6_9FIRM|nr:N-acetylmuramoyl-L-alanine amidase [Pelotomaculum propionicicum]TEB09616.1 S-layer protein [Pelotomaculum propionicicum]